MVKINPLSMIPSAGTRLTQGMDQGKSSHDFSKMLGDAIKNVNSLQKDADTAAVKLALGEVDDVHQVMIATEQAKLALQLTVQVRNKLVEAYQEISRMQF
jgi:flagellar hook-basal body complex protein FliE